MGRNEFDARIAGLQRRVGSGRLRGSLGRDQAYAAVQENDYTLHHPQGGQAGFQRSALYDGHRAVLAGVAAAVNHGDVRDAMADGMTDVDRVAAGRAPKETTVLARSGHVRVLDGGRVVRDRAPAAGRERDAPSGGRGGRTGGNPARRRADRRRGR